jgi:hypothetical protein
VGKGEERRGAQLTVKVRRGATKAATAAGRRRCENRRWSRPRAFERRIRAGFAGERKILGGAKNSGGAYRLLLPLHPVPPTQHSEPVSSEARDLGRLLGPPGRGDAATGLPFLLIPVGSCSFGWRGRRMRARVALDFQGSKIQGTKEACYSYYPFDILAATVDLSSAIEARFNGRMLANEWRPRNRCYSYVIITQNRWSESIFWSPL